MSATFCCSNVLRSVVSHAARATLWPSRRTLVTAASEATFESEPFKLFKLDSGPSRTSTVTRDEAAKYYRSMQTIRRMETAAAKLYRSRIIRGFCHLYSGQEAIAVGMEARLQEGDAVITAYRAHGWTYTRGVPVVGVLAELTGRSTGCSKGKGGSMHMYGKDFYGGNGIVGAQVPVGAGIAFALKYQDKPNICVALYGDGAANQGQLYEAYNMAKLWDLPCIFVCENNGYAMGTSAPRSSANIDYYTRGDYVPGIWVDAMDVMAVRSATEFSRQYALECGPIKLECETYRYYGHSMSDPGTSYRSREEIQEVRDTRDPITSFRERVLAAGLLTEDEFQQLDAEVKQEVDAAAARAQSDPELPLEELYKDVYCQPPAGLKVRGCEVTVQGEMAPSAESS